MSRSLVPVPPRPVAHQLKALKHLPLQTVTPKAETAHRRPVVCIAGQQRQTRHISLTVSRPSVCCGIVRATASHSCSCHGSVAGLVGGTPADGRWHEPCCQRRLPLGDARLWPQLCCRFEDLHCMLLILAYKYAGPSQWCKRSIWPHAPARRPGEATSHAGSGRCASEAGAHPDAMLAPVAPEAVVAGPVRPGEHAHAALLAVLPLAIIPIAWPQHRHPVSRAVHHVFAAACACAQLVAYNSHDVAVHRRRLPDAHFRVPCPCMRPARHSPSYSLPFTHR